MKTIVLVGCGKSKLNRPAPAKDLYTGPLFQKARAYAERFGDQWWILSAKWGLLDPEKVIEPYNLTLEQMDDKWFHCWRVTTRNFISCNLLNWTHDGHGNNFRCDRVRFVLLAGELYSKCFDLPDCKVREFCTIEKPMEGLGVGQRLQFLNRALGITAAAEPVMQSPPGTVELPF